jgi:hypothetical protein
MIWFRRPGLDLSFYKSACHLGLKIPIRRSDPHTEALTLDSIPTTRSCIYELPSKHEGVWNDLIRSIHQLANGRGRTTPHRPRARRRRPISTTEAMAGEGRTPLPLPNQGSDRFKPHRKMRRLLCGSLHRMSESPRWLTTMICGQRRKHIASGQFRATWLTPRPTDP